MLKLRGYHFSEAEFFKAIRLEDARSVTAFLQAGINPNAIDDDGESALVHAIRNADERTALVIAAKADPNLRDRLGNAPLHLALKRKKQKVFEYLLERGADVNIPGNGGRYEEGQTVLYLAAARDDAELAKRLLKLGADPNKADDRGSLPLAEAVLSINSDLEVVKLLVEAGADVNGVEEENGATPLILLASNRQISASIRNEGINYLLKKGARKDHRTKRGKSAYDWAKAVGNEKTAQLLK